jgi:two-component system, LytTR family, response regulator
VSRIRVVIVDDEPLARRGIRQLLAAHDDVEVAGEARDGREAVRVLREVAPDLVFLDVQMPELDGFAVLRALDTLPAVIFVTAFDTFAVKAFELHALDYLVKPLHEARFHQALARARERLRSREAVELARRLSLLLAAEGKGDGPAELMEYAGPPPETPRRLVIATGGADLVLDVAEIQWIEADDYYAAVHARDRRHLIRESLSSLEARLAGSRFVRVHRSALVNLARVREVRSVPGEDPAVVLHDGTRIPLSRRRRRQVAAALRRFAG